MASNGIGQIGQVAQAEAAPPSEFTLAPVQPPERSCNQEIETLMKDYTSVIEDVIFPKYTHSWTLYWSNWPHLPKLPVPSVSGESQLVRMATLLEVIRSLVDRTISFHIAQAASFIWGVIGLTFHIIYCFWECYGCLVSEEFQTIIAITSITTYSAVILLLLHWSKMPNLSKDRSTILAVIMIFCHILTITRMVIPNGMNTLIFRVVCLRAIAEIPLATNQDLSSGWLRKLILDAAKVIAVFLQLGHTQTQPGVFSFGLFTFTVLLYLLSLLAGFIVERSDIITKKKFFVGVERLSERIYQFMTAAQVFEGQLPDTTYHLQVSAGKTQLKQVAIPISKILPQRLNSAPKFGSSTIVQKQRSQETPRETSRPLTKTESEKRVLRLQHEGSGRRLPPQPKPVAKKEPESKKKLQPDTKLKPLQKQPLLPPSQMKDNFTQPNPKKLVSLNLDCSPKFGTLDDDKGVTFNSPEAGSCDLPTPSDNAKYNPVAKQISVKDPMHDLLIGNLTVVEVMSTLPTSRVSTRLDCTQLTSLFDTTVKRLEDTDIRVSISNMLAAIGVGPNSADGVITEGAIQAIRDEIASILQNCNHEVTMTFTNLYQRGSTPMQFGKGRTTTFENRNTPIRSDSIDYMKPDPALVMFASMVSASEQKLDLDSLYGDKELVEGSKCIVHAIYSQAEACWAIYIKFKYLFTGIQNQLEYGKNLVSIHSPSGGLSPIKLALPKSSFHLPKHLTPDIEPNSSKDSRRGSQRVQNVKDSMITLGAKSYTDEKIQFAEVTPKKSSLKQSNGSNTQLVPTHNHREGPFSLAVVALGNQEQTAMKSPYANRIRTESVDEVYFSDFRNQFKHDVEPEPPLFTQSFGFLAAQPENAAHTQPHSKKRVHFSETAGSFSMPKTKSHPTTPRDIMSPKFGNERGRQEPKDHQKKSMFKFDLPSGQPMKTFIPNDGGQLHQTDGADRANSAAGSPAPSGVLNPVSPPTASLKTFQSNYEDIVAMVVHDMRSPLGCIIGNLDLIDMELRESVQKLQNSIVGGENKTPSAMGGSYAGRSHTSFNLTSGGMANQQMASLYALLSPLIKSSKSATTLLETLVNDMLDAARISKGIFKVSSEDVDVRKVVQECLETVGIAAKAKRLNLHFDVEGTGRIISDSQRIKQILLNFLSNSIKFTPANGSIRVRVEDWGGKTLRWTVEDNGEGIKPEHMKNMFEKFHSDRASRSNSKGIGLGLYICKNIIEALGPKGSISVSSEPRVSTKISFDLFKNMLNKHHNNSTDSSKDVSESPLLKEAAQHKNGSTNICSVPELEIEPKRTKLLDAKSPRAAPTQDFLTVGTQKLPGFHTAVKEKPVQQLPPAAPTPSERPAMNPALTHSQRNDIFRLTDAGVAVSKRIIEVRLRTGRNHKFSLVEGNSQCADAMSNHERSVKSFHHYKQRSIVTDKQSKQDGTEGSKRSRSGMKLPRTELSEDEESQMQEDNKTVHKCESIMQASVNLCPTPNDSNNLSRQELNSAARRVHSNSQMDNSSKIFNVLIVEDEPALMELYGHFCERFSQTKKLPVEFLQATSLEDGLRVVSQVQLDVVITDFSLPDGNGLQLARELENYAESCRPVLVLASGERSFDAQKTHEISQRFFQVIHKPISMKLWIETLEECIGEVKHRDTQVLANLSPRFPMNYSEDSCRDSETDKNF